MANFTGQLRSNEIFSGLFNMIISQQVFADNIAGTYSKLVDMSRVDGTLYGDTKLYYSTDVLKSTPWGNDAEATNLLALHRPKNPDCQAIYLDIFRQISLTVDQYLSRRAWSNEGAFSEFNSVILGWIRDTKRVYDATTFNAFIGSDETNLGKQEMVISVASQALSAVYENGEFLEGGENKEATLRLFAQTVANAMADLLTNLQDVTRDYNDYGNLRSYNKEDLVFIWNASFVNQIRKLDLPTIFHKDFIDKFAENVLPARYFGRVNDASVTTSDGLTIRALEEMDLDNGDHVFAGDLLPAGITLTRGEDIIIPTYTEDNTICFKVMHKRSVPFMSAFEVGTSFFNPKSLTENHYLTWGRNTLEHLKNYPMITARVSFENKNSVAVRKRK